MPKRTRCPHCDRLFSRDVIDEHIRKCRYREYEIRTRRRVPRRKNVVIDGNNLAYYLSPTGTPRLSNIIRARNSLINAGYRPVVIVSAALKYRIDDPDKLRSMIQERKVIETRRGTNDDLAIINYALKYNTDIVSNDRFLDYLDRYPWIPDRLKKYRMTPSGLILI
ncbi:MAG: hypothetical protein BAJATHORv1_110036 [Candidatus Thorarchaeota archaeon]|nr:MAG: hypothetical protein BAJATHORv1_110036 [Candidatus Thorarchaeota archaeon]